jgi:Potassium-transporting ATPase A subunit
MMPGEISPGGVGSGLYGLLMIAMIAVFLDGLMVGRTPEFLRKQIAARRMRMTHVALYCPLLPGHAVRPAHPPNARIGSATTRRALNPREIRVESARVPLPGRSTCR